MPGSPVSFVKNAPVTSLTTAESIVGAVLTFLVAHHVIGGVDVSATTQTIAPFVALALPAVFGALKWRLVTPMAKVKDIVERDGLVSDADFARISALLDDKLHDWGLVVDDEDEDPYEDAPVPDSADLDLVPGSTDGYAAEHSSDHLPEHATARDQIPSGMAAGA